MRNATIASIGHIVDNRVVLVETSTDFWQPLRVAWRVAPRGMKWYFTEHARRRMKDRGIKKPWVIHAIANHDTVAPCKGTPPT